MDDIHSFFSKDITEKQAITFLIEGRTKDKSFYNYITRKIVSQLEVSRHIYPMGPSVLIKNTKFFLLPLYRDMEPFILKRINQLDKDHIDYLAYSKEYFDQLLYSNKITVSNLEFNKKINKYLTEKQREKIGKHYKTIKTWIEIELTINNNLNNKIKEKDCYINGYDEYMKSASHFEEYIKLLKQDIVVNYNSYKLIFTHDFKDDSLLEIIDYLRKALIDKMLVKFNDNKYRDYDYSKIHPNNPFFDITTDPKDIVNQMDLLNKEYEEAKKIKNINKYIDKIVIIFQKFVKIHPYRDGNGRTSRLLLDIMLLNRNIFPPILYTCNYERYFLDDESDKYTINNKKNPIIKYVKEKIKETYLEFNSIIDINNYRSYKRSPIIFRGK